MLCADIDILKLEPGLFAGTEFSFPSQELCRGMNGSLAGTAFTASGESFISRRIGAGNAIYLTDGLGVIDNVYEVVSVVSATQLVLSMVRMDETADPISIGTGANLLYRIRTFGPQIAQAQYELSQRLRLKPGYAESVYGLEDLTDQKNLRAACVFWTLSMIFGSLYGMYTGSGTDAAAAWKAYKDKQTDYMERAESSLRNLKLSFTGL